MILTGSEIEKQVASGEITINPFFIEQLNPNSYDIRIGGKLIRYKNGEIDSKLANDYEIIDIPQSGMLLLKNVLYLGSSIEIIGSNKYVPILHNKSGIARLGLFIHITANLIDLGSFGNLTLQLYPSHDIRIYPNMLIGQVSFWESKGNVKLYNGKYMNSRGPVASLNHLNFRNEEV